MFENGGNGGACNRNVRALTVLSKGCGWCQAQSPIIEQLQAEGMMFETADINELASDPDRKHLMKHIKWRTPTTLFFLDEEVVGKVAGRDFFTPLKTDFQLLKCGNIPKRDGFEELPHSDMPSNL